ncbi:hypothetical protein HMN09_00498000 [Mycena chlorophos]|uniref:Uncharacterized protein n=1 Tax=Mycena chlorophos TaxID=658473 RepID=A0A8H6TB03_MYCCL|nr:hypothetical protein HMN09_00498000 [Mycena chlorophos]
MPNDAFVRSMTRATLLQRVLNKPSQKYSDSPPPLPTPPRKQYYSAKPALLALAAAATVIDDAPRPHVREPKRDDNDDDNDNDEDTFYTPRSSVVLDDADADDLSMTMTATTTKGTPTRALYTDQDWANELKSLVNNKRARRASMPVPVVARVSHSRSPTPSIMMSMTALLEEDEDPTKISVEPPSSVIISTDTPPLTYSRSSTPSHRRTRSTTSSVYIPPSLPSGPPDLPSYGTPAYTSLVVPPAPLPSQPLTRSTSLSKRIKSTLRPTADLSRSRLAQATMASIEVVAGLASAKSSTHQPPRLGFTHYRTPPSVSKSGILVQVWAVGLDSTDLRLLGNTATTRPPLLPRPRTQSIGRFIGRSINFSRRSLSMPDSGSIFDKDGKEAVQAPAQVGFVPGRSFVGRVMECGWEVRDETARRGEWVVGLLDIRKSGALAEYIIVDRHRIHRIPQPYTPGSHSDMPLDSRPPSRASFDGFSLTHSNQESPYPSRPSSVVFALNDSPNSSRPSSRQQHYPMHRKSMSAPAPSPPPPPPGPTLDEFALLPLGLPAYRAVRTLVGLEGSTTPTTPGVVSPEGELEVDPMSEPRPKSRKYQPRALVLNGHAGIGAVAARLLVARGWRVCIHAPGTLADPATPDTESEDAEHMSAIQSRARGWGVEEVVFDDGGAVGDEDADWGRASTVRAIERLIDDGDVFDAVVDTLGGRPIWAAGEKLLQRDDGSRRSKIFTTTVGDCPGRPIPTAKDNFRSGLRSMHGGKAEKKSKKAPCCAVSYAWVNAGSDVDWEGGDVRDALSTLIGLALDREHVRPFVEDAAPLPFERAVEVFEGASNSGRAAGVRRGGAAVVKVAG